MPKTITLRVPDRVHRLFLRHARQDNRTLANAVETAAVRHISECLAAGEAGLARVLADRALMGRLRRSARQGRDARLRRFARGLARRGDY